MRSTKKKGQVSLEFLTTYGWAFLIALIMIGALAYFGVLNPSKFTPKRCTLGQEIRCEGFMIGLNMDDETPVIKARLGNSLASRIKIVDVTYTNREKVPLSGCRLISPAPADLPVTVMEGEAQDFESVCDANTGNIFDGDKIKLDMTVTYYLSKSGPEYTNTVQGEMYDEVQRI